VGLTASRAGASAPANETSPELSIVIPIYDEASIVCSAVGALRDRLQAAGLDYEIWLAENGSRDGTPALARQLAERWPDVHTFSVPEANYGLALRRGIERARGAIVICEEIDLCDVDFHQRAVAMLRAAEADMVIGSKLVAGALDQRPIVRHAASLIYSGLLRAVLGFPGTDTHGLKAFRRATVGPVAARCVVERDVFASELVIRSYRAGLLVREIPVQLSETRPPSVHLLRRVPGVLGSLFRLVRAIGLR